MKVLIAPDKFKDALDVYGVCEAIERGIHYFDPAIQTQKHPLADGGEGTAQILTHHNNGQLIYATVHDPLYRKIQAPLGISGDGKTAFIEMAAASGLQLLKPEERNCYYTTSYGTGELIQKAIDKGVQHIVLGIGGSASHDAGIGIAAALGYDFFDVKGNVLFPAGKNLDHIYSIEKENLYFDPEKVTIEIACDVQNPLTGPNGASHTYGPQKGATGKQVAALEAGTRKWHELVKKIFGKDVNDFEGSGAAGGVGAGSIVFLNASLQPGIELVMKHTGFHDALKNADLVITGEGQIDEQNLDGKVVKGVAKAALEYRIPVAALCGALKADPALLSDIGVHYANAILQKPATLEEALNNTSQDLEAAAYYLVAFQQVCKQA